MTEVYGGAIPQVLGVGVCIQKAIVIKVEEFIH